MAANLAPMGSVSAATNLIITGTAGAGKTCLPCALGAGACKQTLRACCIRMPDMLGHFQSHKDNLREQIRYRYG
ncbi:MAG: ATP-binding protein [Lachnospiraceae bacterium]|jgi:DNA replication protein DnaC|nr:ATP-binding protein [Lachnospiraceae bacterium]